MKKVSTYKISEKPEPTGKTNTISMWHKSYNQFDSIAGRSGG